jgi:hypothetical protein
MKNMKDVCRIDVKLLYTYMYIFCTVEYEDLSSGSGVVVVYLREE